MPEGDSIFRAARTLNKAMAGHVVTRFETAYAHLDRVNVDSPLAGRTIDKVDSAGKHILMFFSGDLILRTHMRMNGSWHIYRPGEKWQMPRHAMRILIETAGWVAVAFNVYSAEFIRSDRVGEHRTLATLGPDLLGDFDADRALASLRHNDARPVHEVLLDQRVMAGLGNVYKSEILFLSRVHPDMPAGALDDSRWREMMALAQKLLRENVADGASGQIVTYHGLRRTTGRLNPADRLWVYGRGRRPCRRCGATIASRKDGDDARVTYWCPRCQPAPA